MSLDERFELFGGPTETLAAERVWLFKQEQGDWPFFEEAVDFLAESPEVAGDLQEAERRLLKAIALGEVVPKLRLRDTAWGAELTEQMSDCLARRYIDATMMRQDREDQC